MKAETTIKSALVAMVMVAALMGGFGAVYTNALNVYNESPDPVFLRLGEGQINQTEGIANQLARNLTDQKKLPNADPTGIFDITAVYIFDFGRIIAQIPTQLFGSDGIVATIQIGTRELGIPAWVWLVIGAMITIFIGLKVGAFIFRRISDL